jgi:hypothetical protein
MEGLTEWSKKMATLNYIRNIHRVCKAALFDGAEVVANALRNEINALPTGNKTGTPEKPINTIHPLQKEGLLDSMGLAPMSERNGKWTTKAGFDGYNTLRTYSFPQGQPNLMIAASIEGGTSFRTKNPFITRTVTKSRNAAKAAMEAKGNSIIREIMEES